jgi:hypothetical protein
VVKRARDGCVAGFYGRTHQLAGVPGNGLSKQRVTGYGHCPLPEHGITHWVVPYSDQVYPVIAGHPAVEFATVLFGRQVAELEPP